MNKRIRKKRRVGEFVEYGFSVWFAFKPDTNRDLWWDKLLDFIDSQVYWSVCGGGGDLVGHLFCTKHVPRKNSRKSKYCSMTIADESTVRLFLYNCAEIDRYEVGFLESCNALGAGSWEPTWVTALLSEKQKQA